MIHAIQFRILRAFLCLIRIGKFDLPLQDGHFLYRWVQTPDGRFDHWVESPTEQFNLSDVLGNIGFWRFLWQILTHSVLISGGRQRRGAKEGQKLGGSMYACHGQRALLSDQTSVPPLSVLNACKWILRTVDDLDGIPATLKNSRVRNAAWHLRTASLDLLRVLAAGDSAIEELLQRAFGPFPKQTKVALEPREMIPR